MDFIEEKWPWLSVLIIPIDLFAWLFDKDWSLITSRIVATYKASTLEVTTPIWSILLLILLTLICVWLWDFRHHFRKKKIKPIELNKLDQEVMEHFLSASELEKFTTDDVAEDLNTSIPDMRKTLVWLEKHNLIEKDYEGYYISDSGVLAYRALGA